MKTCIDIRAHYRRLRSTNDYIAPLKMEDAVYNKSNGEFVLYRIMGQGQLIVGFVIKFI